MKSRNLNRSQRRALEELVRKACERKIERQREICSNAVARITKQVKAELGAVEIDEQRNELERQLKELEKAKEALGFMRYNDRLIPGSEAMKRVNERAATERQKVADLEAEMDRIVSAIWTADKLSEVKQMVDEAIADD